MKFKLNEKGMKIFFLFVSFLLMLSFVSADYKFQNDSGINLVRIDSETGNLTSIGNISANYFIGSGRYLTDLDIGSLNMSDYYTKTQVDSLDTSLNSSLRSWVDSMFVRFSEIVSQVGNWSQDKPNYYNKTEISDLVSSGEVNSSNYWDDLDTPADILGSEINNDLSWVELSQLVSLVGNWSEDKVNYYLMSQVYNRTEVEDMIGSGDVNSSDYWDGLDTPSDISGSEINNDLDWVEMSEIVSLVGNWSNDKVDYYLKTEVFNKSETYNRTAIQSMISNADVDTLDGYDSSYFMPLNTSVDGDFDFNDGWQDGGVSIIDGDVYAQSGYFYDLNSLSVSNLDINGSLYPELDNTFDVGNQTLRWRNGRFGGEVSANSFVGDGADLTDVDAEFLDGIDSADFLRSNVSDVFNGDNLRVEGDFFHDSTSASEWFYFLRGTSNDNEYTRVGTDDGFTYFERKNDEGSARIRFSLEATDTESGGGASANSGDIDFVSTLANGRQIFVDGHEVYHEGNLNVSEIGGLDGSGTANYIPKFSDSDTLADSVIYDDGTNVGIGTSGPNEKLHVDSGALQFSNLGSGQDNVDIIKMGETTNLDEFALEGMFGGTGETGNSIKFRSTWVDNIFTLRGDGNVGIGTSSPTYKLNVEDDVDITMELSRSTTGNPGIRFSNTGSDSSRIYGASSAGDSYFRFFGNSDEVLNIGKDGVVTADAFVGDGSGLTNIDAASVEDNWVDESGDTMSGLLNFSNSFRDFSSGLSGYDYLIRDETDSEDWIRIDGNNNWMSLAEDGGNVGIGISNPGQSLHIQNDNAIIRLDETDGGGSWDIGAGSGGNGLFSIYDLNAGASRLSIDSAGEVGIGTTSPQAKLDVNGQAHFNNGMRSGFDFFGSSNSGTARWAKLAEITLASSYDHFHSTIYLQDRYRSSKLTIEVYTGSAVTSTAVGDFSVRSLSDNGWAPEDVFLGRTYDSTNGRQVYEIWVNTGTWSSSYYSVPREYALSASNVEYFSSVYSSSVPTGFDSSQYASGDITVDGTITADSFVGAIDSSNVEDIWVDESGDTMSGALTFASGGSTDYGITSTPSAIFGESDGATRGYLKIFGKSAGSYGVVQMTSSNLHIDSSTAGKLYLNHYSQTDTTINPNGGNVGIGDATPDAKLDVEGTVYASAYGRDSHSQGHLVGSYNSVGANSGASNPIYTIGSSYNPSDAALGNMYGIGYSHANFWNSGLGVGESDAGWGLYVAADGDIRATISGSNGDIWSTGTVTANAFVGDGSGLTNLPASAVNDIWVNEGGDTMSGNLNMNLHNILDVANLQVKGIYDPDDGLVQVSDSLAATGYIKGDYFQPNGDADDSYSVLRVYDSSTYAIGMKSSQSYGQLNDWAMTFTMNADADRGFLWRDSNDAASDGAMSLTTGGILTVKDRLAIGGSGSSTTALYATKTGSGTYGVHAVATERGVYGYANGYGVYGSGSYGVYGTGTVGVRGAGSGYGVQGASTNSYGVYGAGSEGGVYGKDSDGSSHGILGQGSYGVKGNGTSYGVYATSPYISLRVDPDGSNTYKGIDVGSGAAYGVYSRGNGYDYYAAGAGTNYAPFTGSHEVKLSAGISDLIEKGMIVSATGKVEKRVDNNSVSISSTLPEVLLSDSRNDKKVFGVYVQNAVLPEDHWYYNKSEEGDVFASVNALGEGRVWVTNINGEIENGDYITTSEIAGYGMGQDDDLLHSYTLGKAIESPDWENAEKIEYDGEEYKKYLIAVTYVSG